jgi:Mrp family chromosome partitioning ATPase/capsular polysaccharide biosynthesis protein
MDFTNGTRDRQGPAPVSRAATPQGRSVFEWVRVLRDGLPAVILLLLLGLGAGAAFTAIQPREYQSVATLVAGSSRGFLEPESSSGLAPVTSTVTRLAGSAAVIEGTQREYIASAPDSTTIRRRRREASLAWVRKHLTARQVADSGIVELAGTGGNQKDARALTQAAATSLKSAIETDGSSTDSRGRAGGIAIRDFQTADDGLVSPTPVRNLVLGGNVGLLLGIVAGLGLGARRRRLRRPDEMAAELGIPILATVSSGDARESMPRALGAARARLQRLSEPDHGTVFLLTGTARAERAAELGESLARVFAASSRTLLVDADLSQQHASRHLDVDGLPGLGELLNGRGPQQLLRPEQVLVTTVNGTGPEAEIEMLPAGEKPADVAAALSGSALARSIQNLRLRYEFVIVVGPGFDRPEEVIPLASVSDWTVLVTPRGERASTFEAMNALALTDALAGRVAGAIIVDRR